MAEILLFPSVPATSIHSAQASPPADTSSVLDEGARRAALDPQQSFIVEAPAGSGKTGLLMQRFLKLLGDAGTVSPEEILGITFTRKATAELRERIVQQLEAAATDNPPRESLSAFDSETRALAKSALERSRERGWDILHNPRRLRIQTIDALCVEIAATLPLLSGSAARTPVDDAPELYRQAARNTLRQLGGPDRHLHEALETVLLHRDANLGEVEDLLAQMLGTREQWAELVPLDRASLTDEVLDEQVRLRLERTLEQIVCAGLSHALKLFPQHVLAELASLAHAYGDEPGYNGKDSPLRLCHEHPGPPSAEAAHLDHWHALLSLLLTKEGGWRKALHKNILGVELSKRDKERLQQLVQDIQAEPLREALQAVRNLPPAKYPDDQWRQAKALFRLLPHTLAELRLLFAQTGECDFSEFSLAARNALEHHAADYAAGSGTVLRHLLVDEMQDTSSAQYDLLFSLTRYWDGRSQTLFLVGDPKQSIYLFRQARVERFLRTARDSQLGDVPLQRLQLTANFRSRPALVTGVNRDFSQLFTPAGAAVAAGTADVSFAEATPTRAAGAASGMHWHTRVLQPDTAQLPAASEGLADVDIAVGTLREGAGSRGLALAASGPEASLSPKQADAAAIRHIVEQWRAKPLPYDRLGKPWRIAILANARRHLAPIVAEFNRNDGGREPVPYRAVKVERLDERQEVLDALSLTRALRHPADCTAWFAVLRAPWCGLDAADLLMLAAEADGLLAKSTVPQLVEKRADFLSVTGQQRLQRVWSTLQAALAESSRKPLSTNAERTWRSLGGDASLREPERKNVAHFFSLLAKVEDQGDLDLPRLKRRMQELYAEPAGAEDAVELMTIHSAKGLEWDVVLVPDLGRQGQREGSRLLNWLELESGTGTAVLLAPIASKGEGPSNLYRWLDAVHCARLAAERKRVFYVACTRAREELHLFASAKQGRNGLTPATNSLLQACWPAAAPHFEAAEGAHATEESFAGLASLRSAPVEESSDGSLAPALALAAAAEPAGPEDTRPADTGPADTGSADIGFADIGAALRNRYLPRLTRLPASFDPVQRLRDAAAHRLPYPSASELPPHEMANRPEGSFAARALGNVVHRFLEQIARRLASSPSASALQQELPSWPGRLTASLRSEGLAPAEAGREAGRALSLLTATLADPVGVWLLSPHPAAASERAVTTLAGVLRVDRTFEAGDRPLSLGTGTVWIVDFKTAEHGGRDPDKFTEQQQAVYGPQLARYAAALRADPQTAGADIRLGLYFPSIPRLVHWPAPASASTP